MRFTGRGHPAIRATHTKTLELTADVELTERGTCIVAVDTSAEPPAPMAGPVRVRITAGNVRASLDALANPSWRPGGPIVIRRGPLRLPGTFATDATASAADLPRELIDALRDPDQLVTVDVVPAADTGAVVVLAATDASATVASPALAAELERADEVISADAEARRLAGPDRGDPGGRTLVVATHGLPRPPEGSAGAVIDTVGLAPPLAVAAACPSRAPLTFVEVDGLRDAPAGHRVVLELRRADLPRTLRLAADSRGIGTATVMQTFGRPLPATPDAVPDLPGADVVACCLHPAPAGEAIDPSVRAAIDALLADGTPTKTAAKALAALTGWERRRAYAAIVDWFS